MRRSRPQVTYSELIFIDILCLASTCFRPNLLQAVRRTPQHIYPYMSLAKTNPVVTAPRVQLSSNSNNALQQ